MSRYIDADKIEYTPISEPRGNGIYTDCEIAHKDQIDDMPTADVVEVVRCKDCKHRKKNTFCLHNMRYEDDNGFCSYGERAE